MRRARLHRGIALIAAAAAMQAAVAAREAGSGPIEPPAATALQSFYAGNLRESTRAYQWAIRRDPYCALAYWGLSRVFAREGQDEEALRVARLAVRRPESLSDRDRRLFGSWEAYLAAQTGPGGARKGTPAAARRAAALAIALYPDDVDLWIQRGEMAENPTRAAPYYLAALKIRPKQSFAASWQPQVPPPPAVQPEKTAPLLPCPAQKLLEGLGTMDQKVTTRSPEALAYYKQGLRCMHSYVMPPEVENSSSRAFQYAITLDRDFAMAYWGYSFWDTTRMRSAGAANRALELALKNGSEREQRYCAARVLELSHTATRSDFLDALDGAILAYPEDVELWIWRGKCYGKYGAGGSDPEAIPFQLAAHRLQPEHPGPSHELIHLYEAIGRPLLGWQYALAYQKSAPNMPHANHMIAHLAMRLGRWDDAIRGTRASREKSLAGFPELDPGHHIQVLIQALAHEGRFQEAEAEPEAYRDGLQWARLLRLKAAPGALVAWADAHQESPEGRFAQALAYLDDGSLERAVVLARELQGRPDNPVLYYRYHMLQGRLLVQQGKVAEGLQLLREATARAVQDYDMHAWGGGSSIAETWGEAALRSHRWDEAEEAFTEALAHEHGSIIGALGLQVVSEERGETEQAREYAARAASIWKNADPGALDRQLDRLRGLAHTASAGHEGSSSNRMNGILKDGETGNDAPSRVPASHRRFSPPVSVPILLPPKHPVQFGSQLRALCASVVGKSGRHV